MKNTKVILLGVVTSVMMLATSCSKDPKHPGLEYMPDMYRSPSYEVYSANPNFADSITLQKPVEGTVPRNFTFFNYPETNEGYEAASKDVKNPLPFTDANLAEGKRQYEIFCVHCHGATGQGDGSIVAIGKFPPPPSYSKGNSSRGGSMKDLTDGKIYHTITYGINLMGAHASQISPEDRWKITMYVHQLQNDGAAPTASKDSTSTTKDSSNVTALAK